MGKLFKSFLLVGTVFIASGCLPPKDEAEDPFNYYGSTGSGLEVFETLTKVAMTGFIDPNQFSDLFESELQAELALADEEGVPTEGDVQTETGVQAFFYGLHLKSTGVYERIPLGTANVNDEGFFEFLLPEKIPVFVSIGHIYGKRMRNVFTSPADAEITDGIKENSVLIEQTTAMDYAGSVLFKKLEEFPAFQEMVNSGVNMGALQVAGSVYEDAIAEGEIEEWTDSDVTHYIEKLLEKMIDLNAALQEGGVTPADVYAKADLQAFNYDSILTGINSQVRQDLAYRAMVGNQSIDTALGSASDIDTDLNSKALEEMDLDSMDAALFVAKASAKVKLRSTARRNFSGDDLKAVLAGIDIKMKTVSSLEAAKIDLVGLAGKSEATNPFTSIYKSTISQNYDSTLRSIFSGFTEDEKTEFKTNYTGTEVVDPDHHDTNLLEIMKLKCEAWGATVEPVPTTNTGGSAEVFSFIDDGALFYCSFPSTSMCEAKRSTMQSEVFATYGYNFFGNTTLTLQSSVKFCKISEIKAANDAAGETYINENKYDGSSLFLNAEMCRKMGLYVPDTPVADIDNYGQYCYFHVKF